MENRYLIDARMHKFWSLEEASKRIGVQKKTYERWEKGESIPYLKSLGIICTTFKEDDPEKLGYVIENKRVRLKRSEDLPTERATASRDASASVGSREPLKLSHVQRIGKMVLLTLAIPSAELQAAGQESASELETPVASATPEMPSPVSVQPLPSFSSQSVGPQGTIDGEASTQKPSPRNPRDSSFASVIDRVGTLKAYGTLNLGEATTCQQQIDIYKAIEQWSTMDNEHITDPFRVTRRDLITLASVSFPLLTNIRRGQFTAGTIEEFLSEATASVTTCWYILQRSGGLPLVEFTLSQYLPELVEVVKCSSVYRQRASYLAAQSFLQLGLVAHHHVRFAERVVHCQQAVEYASESGDMILLVASLEHLSNALLTNKQLDKSLKTYLQAKGYGESAGISGLSRSVVRSGLSLAYAKQGKSEEVIQFVDEAYGTFAEPDDETPIFLLADYGRYQLILEEGLSTLDLGNHAKDQGRLGRAQKYWRDAAEKLGKVEQLPSSVLVPARIAAEIEIARALAYAKAGNMEAFITAFEKGARLAKELGSGKRKEEAREALNAAFGQWRGDQRITGLWELLI